MLSYRVTFLAGFFMPLCAVFAAGAAPATRPAGAWSLGAPITTYWAGPGFAGRPMTEADARQLAEGNFNLVWSHEGQLDIVHRHKLRALLNDPLLRPESLDDPARREQLDALIARVKRHPALYAYQLVDEPGAAAFPALGRLVTYLRERDPAHMAYINLLPTYANNQQLGTQGDTVTAYKEHLRQYLSIVKPAIISYDHYHFAAGGKDRDQYFLNLALIRQAALENDLPFLNIVQACSWHPSMRAPSPRELSFLIYTTLAYGGQGVSYFVYSYQPFYRPDAGQLTTPDGAPTELWHAARTLNRDFIAIASELQELRSLGAYHAGMIPPGAEPVPANLPFRIEPPIPQQPYQPLEPVQGLLLGTFGPHDDRVRSEAAAAAHPTPSAGHRPVPTHVLIVNLDYKESAKITLKGPGPFEVFAPEERAWRPQGFQPKLVLVPGGGFLLRTGSPQ